MVRPSLALALALAACAAHAPGTRPVSNAAPPEDDVTLYRDAALVRQHVAIEVGAAGIASARITLAAGIAPQQVIVVERDGVALRGLHANADETAAGALHVDVAARPGHHALVLAYVTDRLHWDAAYTVTTAPGRARATVRGAIAIRNTTGLALDASVRVVDAAFAASSALAADPRELGRLHLAPGETRIELLADSPPRALRRVLVYDPIGPKWNNASGMPLHDRAIGSQPAPSAVTESYEIERDERAAAGLPAGPVRLVELRDDGTLAVLGEARLFDDATRVADADTIGIGTATGVIAHRVRRELSIDDERRRVVEEIELSIANSRATPVDMVLREHMYRGLTWSLVYDSTRSATKEGPQQIALRTLVPANSEQRILYVVVYSWEP
ncbi:MAG TPA: hypothetical protein VMJ10_00555 [Kofleriaceae bacterium]|nr:hypothetical protein [Kofleriaceae bacterium]